MTIDFSLESTNQQLFKLKDLTTPLVIFFYPRDNTPGCTIENQEFKLLYEEFKALGVEVAGISRDSVATHCKFAAKFALPFILLADPDETVCNMFNVIKDKLMYGKPVRGIERSTFVLNKNKEILTQWRKVKPANHAQEVLTWLKSNPTKLQ